MISGPKSYRDFRETGPRGLTTTGLTGSSSYKQGFLRPRVLQGGVLTTRGWHVALFSLFPCCVVSLVVLLPCCLVAPVAPVLCFPGWPAALLPLLPCVPFCPCCLVALLPGGGAYSHTLPIRICAAQLGRDFEAPEEWVSISGAFSRTGYNISNARKLQFCKQPFEIIYLSVADYEEAFISCISRTNKEISF